MGQQSDLGEQRKREAEHHLAAGERAPSSVKRMMVAVRGLHRFLAEEDPSIADPAAEVELPRTPRGLPKALTEAEVGALLDSVPGQDAIARRDRAILEVLYGTGMRVGELAGLSLGDLDLDAGLVRVFGKGAKERIVPLGRHAIVALVAWLAPEGRGELEPDRWASRGDAEAVAQRVDEEAQIFARQLQSAEAREAFTAFVEKRAPDFKKLRTS